MFFGSFSTTYFVVASGGSVEKTPAASTLPSSSSLYALIPASGVNLTSVTP